MSDLTTFNRSWRISTTPNTTKNCLIIFKLLQQSNLVILSRLTKRYQNLNPRKKSSVYYWKGRFMGVSALKTQLSVINWTFFPRIQILIFLREATQNDHIRLLYKFENDQKNFGCVGSCGYDPASVKNFLMGWLLVLGLKGQVECATVWIKSVVILKYVLYRSKRLWETHWESVEMSSWTGTASAKGLYISSIGIIGKLKFSALQFC